MTSNTIKDLMLFRSNIKNGSTASQILEMSYGISEFCLSEMAQKIKKPYRYTKKIVLEMKYLGYIDAADIRGSYSITQKGRWFAICQELDGISFLSLCLLSEVYCKVKSNPEFFYSFSTFRQYYEKGYSNSLTAIYCRKNILKSLQFLKTRNLVYVVSHDFIKMTNPMIEFLHRYDGDLELLFLWCNKTHEKCIIDSIESDSFNFGKIMVKGSN